MIAALILVISLGALAHFAVSCWRAMLISGAATPLSQEVQTAAGLTAPLGAADFAAILAVHELCPELGPPSRKIRWVRSYYDLLAAFGNLLGSAFPVFSAWANREMATCSQYAAVLVDQRLVRNFRYAAELRSL